MMKKILFIELSILLSAPTFGADDNHRDYSPKSPEAAAFDRISTIYGEGGSLSNNQGRYDKSMSYDKMGNILSLMRYGLRDDNKYGLIDNLSYGYNDNQLIKVDDTVSGPYYAGVNYCGNNIYDGDETMILNDVGYALYDKNGILSFHYHLKDHLGDSRVVMNEITVTQYKNLSTYFQGSLQGSLLNCLLARKCACSNKNNTTYKP